jgi:diadenosine tetraphosphate (Ap4A) HIT family hydrolase
MNSSKKLRLFILIFIALVGGSYLLFWGKSEKSQPDCAPCVFCNPEVLCRQVFYEDRDVLALCTHKPVVPGHFLIIPKRHVERYELLTENEVLQIHRTIVKVNAAAEKVFGTCTYLLLQKNGREVGQSVPHLHFHYIPRKSGDDSMIAFVLKMFISDMKKPRTAAEMQETIDAMRCAQRE